jgi:16S rRNA (guanine966-N2)-methyltransferase
VPRKHRELNSKGRPTSSDDRKTEVQIIGGTFRGRRLHYHGDATVRPMKHRTREAIFNLISTECAGRHAIDLFAGTGALGLEALSRGANSATFIEKHVPTARVIEENIRTLGVEDRTRLLVTSAFLWAKRDLSSDTQAALGDRGWLVFCSPPYKFFHERQEGMLDLVQRVQRRAPDGSILIVEADDPFDFALLRDAVIDGAEGTWDMRSYAPAIVGVWRKQAR